ncbi:MAG: hypothetical protein FH756_20075 [Firmicutes bacterium]|nr:hypothetical protein [Bacillota bacterium]
MENRNVLWEKHRIFLPEMRKRAVHRCKHCKFFVQIKGKQEVRSGCVKNIKAYYNLEIRVPKVIPIMEIIKRVGLEGLEECLINNDPEAQSCGKFQSKQEINATR